MKASELKVGDKIKILSVPGEGIPNYYIDKDTVRVYKKIIARKRPVRIYEIQDGQPWYAVKFRRKNGKWEYHFLSVMDEDANWVRASKEETMSATSWTHVSIVFLFAAIIVGCVSGAIHSLVLEFTALVLAVIGAWLKLKFQKAYRKELDDKGL